MRVETVTSVIGLGDVPESIRSLDTLANPDYVDLHTVTTTEAGDKTPEQWARAVLEDTPLGRSAPSLWQQLGLRLGPPHSPDHVQGWKIADRGDSWIRLETASSFITAHAVVHVDARHVSLALFLRYDQQPAALVWPRVSIMHRQAVPAMLRQAVRGE
jgi:hypothetical protein